MTRNRKDLNDTYPELAEAFLAEDSQGFVADGEIVAFDGTVTSFAKRQSRMPIKDREAARKSPVAVYFYLFELLHLEGHDVTALPLRARKSPLKRALSFDNPMRFTSHQNTDGEAYFTEACDKGWEGLIAKRASSPYCHRRSSDWLKFKCAHGQELVIAGFTGPKGARIGLGALLVGYYDDGALKYAGKVGTGFDNAFLKNFGGKLAQIRRETPPFDETVSGTDVTWVTPRYVGEFGFTEWTDSGKLRHPRFLGLRDDKDVHEVVRERSER